MHKTAVQFITLLLTIAIGFAAGFYWANHGKPINTHTKENKELALQIDSLRENIRIRDLRIAKQDSIAQIDSVHIVKIFDRIKQNDAALKQERARVNKLSTDEKVIWLYNYYGIKP